MRVRGTTGGRLRRDRVGRRFVAALVALGTGLVLGVVVPAATAPAPAYAASAVPDSFTFTGSGWGHGLGMSQYGAYGQALAGRTSTQILQHYYNPATVVTDGDNPELRVQVLAGVPSVTITRTGSDWELGTSRDADGNVVWVPLTGSSITAELRHVDGQDRVYVGGYRTNASSWPELRLRWSSGGVRVPGANNGTGSVEYRRGAIFLGPLKGGVNVVSIVRLNQYLYGLAEMPSSWPTAALEAQAVAGRTFALRAHQAGRRSDINAHLTDETSSQKYTAWNKESETTGGTHWGARWKAAVDAIAHGSGGRSVRHSGTLAQTFYSSSTGGRTTNSEQVWGGATIPYLRSRDDHWASSAAVNNPRASWSTTRTQAQVAAIFGLPDVKALDITRTATSGAVMQVRATSSAGRTANLTHGNATDSVRIALGLNSPYFSIRANGGPLADVTRLAGDDRYGTAVAVAREAYSASDDVVIVSGEPGSVVDGLVAAPFARSKNAPILLTRASTLPPATVAELQSRKPARAWVVGGTGVVRTEVMRQLQDLGISVTRIAGDDRYGTAAAVAAEMGSSSTVVVASGMPANIIDAAAVGGPAAALGHPVVLTRSDALTPAARDAIRAMGASRAVVVGGPGAVSTPTIQAVRAAGATPTRLHGANRYATATAVASHFAGSVGTGTVLVANGSDASLVDSLTGGVLGNVTVLTNGARVPAETGGWMAGRQVDRLRVAGGPGAVPDAVVQQLR